MSDSSASAISAVEPSGLAKFSSSVIEELKAQENAIGDSFKDGLRKDGDVQKMPSHMTESFKRWEESFTTPEELALVASVKRQTIDMMNETSTYVSESVDRKSQRIRLELAVKSVAKVTQGVQQLLSSQ